MRVTPALRSFSSGEIDPLLHQRADYQRFQTGLARLNGFLPLVQGGVTRAPGTRYRGSTLTDQTAVLVPFVFAADDACVLEFTHLKMRVWRYGALVMAGLVPYELTTVFRGADLAALRWQQTADVVYLVDGTHPVQKLSRFALNSWTIAAVDFTTGPFRVQNLDVARTIVASATTGAITLTASSALFVAGHVGALWQLTPSDLVDVPLWVQREVVAVGQFRRYDENIYQLTRRAGADVGDGPPVHLSGTLATDKNTEWRFTGDLDGIVRITAVTSGTLASATVLRVLPSDCVAQPTWRWSEAAWSDLYGYPSAIELMDQRLVLAANTAEPRSIWFSAVSDYTDFFPGTEADQSFAFTIAGDGTINRIMNLKAAAAGLHVMALGQEFSTRSDSQAQVIGPTTAVFGLDSAIGSAPADAIAPYGNPIFISRDRAHLVQIAWNMNSGKNEPMVLSRPSQHLGSVPFGQVVWTMSPQPMAWLRRQGGDLAVLLYDPSEDVLGWATITLAGGVCQCLCVTPDPVSGTDVVTMVVKRTIDGVTKRYVEEIAPWFGLLTGETDVSRAEHLQSALTFDPPSLTNTFAVDHLRGQQVYAWTPKGGMGPFTVPLTGLANVTLPAFVSRAQIGLFDATHVVETLDLQATAPDGATDARQKRIDKTISVALHQTAQILAATVEHDFAKAERQGLPKKLIELGVAYSAAAAFSGVTRAEITSGQAQAVRLRFWPDGGAPATITAIYPNISEAGR